MTHKFVIELTDDCKGYEQDVDYLERIYGAELIKEHDEEIYNNAIDDFIRKCEMESRVILDEITHLSYYGLSMRELQRIAEQLKERGNINE